MEEVDKSKFPDIHKVMTEPVLVKDEEGTVILKGSISYASYLYQARLKKYKETMDGINTDSPGMDDEVTISSRHHKTLNERVVKVEIRSFPGTQDESDITTVDDLYEFAEGISVGNALALKIITGQRLGKMKLE